MTGDGGSHRSYTASDENFVVLDCIAIEVHDRKAKLIVTPHQFAVRESEAGKTGWLKVCANFRVMGMAEKWLEINLLNMAVVEHKPDSIGAGLRGRK